MIKVCGFAAGSCVEWFQKQAGLHGLIATGGCAAQKNAYIIMQSRHPAEGTANSRNIEVEQACNQPGQKRERRSSTARTSVILGRHSEKVSWKVLAHCKLSRASMCATLDARAIHCYIKLAWATEITFY